MSDLISRRTALRFAGIITWAACDKFVFPVQGAPAHASAPTPASGYGSDPNLLQRPVSWPLTLSEQQLATLAALCDIVLPAEPPHPSASEVGVHQFLNEWVSAPYPQMQADRTVILNGLTLLEAASRKKGTAPFSQLEMTEQVDLFDDSCTREPTAAFSRRLIELVCDGYYTTREGHAALGYVGNVALASFPGPSPEIMRHLENAFDQLVRPV